MEPCTHLDQKPSHQRRRRSAFRHARRTRADFRRGLLKPHFRTAQEGDPKSRKLGQAFPKAGLSLLAIFTRSGRESAFIFCMTFPR